jgi:hypothetical protein
MKLMSGVAICIKLTPGVRDLGKDRDRLTALNIVEAGDEYMRE